MKYLVIYWIWIIVPFQLQLKSLTHVISQKTSKQVCHWYEHKCVEKKYFVEKNSFEDDKNYVKGFYIKNRFICLSKC